jgi:DHA2 family multidrug resistance protein
MDSTPENLTDAQWSPSFNPWLIAFVVALAAFMEVLDTSIATVALPHIAGTLGAGTSESNWVLTSYLVANAVVLPMSGFMATLIGRKKYMMICLVGFTVASLLCGLSISLGMLLISRVVQGAMGGGLQPMAQAILADSFPPEKHAQAFGVFALTAVVAPIIGPLLGGWITDNYSWRWIFYINVPVGIIAAVLMYRFLEDPPYIARLRNHQRRMDYVGISLLVLGIGALQIMLDKGQEDDWLGSRFIVTLCVVSLVSLVALVIVEWFEKDPVLDVRLFRRFNYAASNLMMFVIGAVMFACLVSLPQFLSTLIGYTATLSGLVISPAGLVVAVMIVIVSLLSTKVAAKWLIVVGWLIMSLAMFYSCALVTTAIDFRTAVIIRIVQSLGLMFLFIPLTTTCYIGMPQENSNQIAGTTNLMRNIGSSVGTSFVGTLLARRSQLHQNNLVAHATAANQRWQITFDGLAMQFHAHGASMATSKLKALSMLNKNLAAQAMALSYVDLYWLLGVACAILAGLALFLPRNDPHVKSAVAMH